MAAIRVIVMVAIAMAAMETRADMFTTSISDDAFHMDYSASLSNKYKGLESNVGLLYVEEDEDANSLFQFGMHVVGDNWSKSGVFHIKIGGRLNYATLESYDALAFTLGGSVRFSPADRVGVVTSAYFAPDITSFLDAEGYQEVGVSVDYQLLTQAFVYAGIRDIELKIEDADVQYDDGIYFGMRLLF